MRVERFDLVTADRHRRQLNEQLPIHVLDPDVERRGDEFRVRAIVDRDHEGFAGPAPDPGTGWVLELAVGHSESRVSPPQLFHVDLVANALFRTCGLFEEANARFRHFRCRTDPLPMVE